MTVEKLTTLNGQHEIAHPQPIMNAEAFKDRMAGEYGFFEGDPKRRTERLRELSVEGTAILLEDINKSLQGSGDSLISEKMIYIADKNAHMTPTISPEDRYDVFYRLVEDIRSCPDDTNPARIGDVLALGVVLLHPFHDGNGRTARTIGLLFRENYDESDYADNYNLVTEGRDKSRKEGGYMILGYSPELPDDLSQSDPEAVSAYLRGLLYEEDSNYLGTFGSTTLKVS